jgi:hypothetical protein
VTMSRQQRELSDMKLKIENFKKMQTSFSFTDAKEKAFFENAAQTLRKRIPVVKNKADSHSLLAKITDSIKRRARADGIVNLHMRDENDQSGAPGGIRVYFSFSGSIRNVTNFIYHLPGIDSLVIPACITAVPCQNSLCYSLDLKVYTTGDKDEKGDIQDQEFLIDFESPVLMQKVYENPIETDKSRKLSSRYGNGILK